VCTSRTSGALLHSPRTFACALERIRIVAPRALRSPLPLLGSILLGLSFTFDSPHASVKDFSIVPLLAQNFELTTICGCVG
jgi:hypothetical protein